MRLRFVFLLLCSVLLGISSGFAQKKIFATVTPNASALNNASEIYNPANGSVTAAGSMITPREQHVALKMNDGRVLIAGGYNDRYLKSMEIYNPATGTFTATVNMNFARSNAKGIMLKGGNALIIGGYNGDYLATVEMYNPSTQTLVTTGSMNEARANPSIVADGDTVLVSGGYNGSFMNSMEVYYPWNSGFATVASMLEAREGHTLTKLADGKVLIVGGCRNAQSDKPVCDNFLSTAEIWDPSNNTTAKANGSLNAARADHTATLLPDGKVLIVGGRNATSSLSRAELYDPSTGLFTIIGNMNVARTEHIATNLGDGHVVISGGSSDQALNSIETYYNGTFTPASSNMSAPRYKHAATLLADGKILLTGGENKPLLVFDSNFRNTSDNIAPNMVFSADSKTGFVSFPGSGVVLAFSTETGAEIKRIATGGLPTFITTLPDGKTLAVVSALSNKLFFVGMDTLTLKSTYAFSNAEFGFGSILTLSPDGAIGYLSSTDTGEVIKFNIATGDELGRLTGLSKPAQITITKDGSTLLVVDTMANKLHFVNAGAMRISYSLNASDSSPGIGFTIANKAVLNSDESYGVIGAPSLSSGDAYHGIIRFKTSTGEIAQTNYLSSTPGYTTLTPDGSKWLILCSGGLALYSTSDFDSVRETPIYSGAPLETANVLVSADSKYAYFTSSSTDLLFEQDLTTLGIIGAIPVGDGDNTILDQASTVAFTPDARTTVVVNLVSNRIDLLSEAFRFKQTKFLSASDVFTGLSIINLSDKLTKIKISAINDTGILIAGDNITNPLPMDLQPNEQKSLDLSQVFNLTSTTGQTGRLDLESDQPIIVGFSAIGQIHADFLSPYTSALETIPFTPDYHYQLHDFIVPEIPTSDDTKLELSLVNPTYSPSTYELIHYGDDGSVFEDTTDKTIAAANREVKSLKDIITTSHLGEVVLMGGNSGNSSLTALSSSEVFRMAYYDDSGTMTAARTGESATTLLSEKVLVAGGKSGSTIYKTTEIFDPSTYQYTRTAGTMNVARYRHTATLLLNGKVLIAGGQGTKAINNTAELYDPSTGGFSKTISMISPRDGHTATRLPNGDVLIVGGIDGYSVSSKAEIYDVEHSVFRATNNNMSSGRVFHTAVLLSSGKVLIAGGFNGVGYLNSAELYDPATGYFTPVGYMGVAHSGHTATLLPDGTVLVAGGMNSSGVINNAEIFDPLINAFSNASEFMSVARVWHTATLTPDTQHSNELKVLITGGYGGSSTLDSSEFYDPKSGMFSNITGSMKSARQNHTAVTLKTGYQGYLRIKSSIGLLLTETYNHGGAETTLGGIDLDKYVGVKKIYSPQFKISSDSETLVSIINGNGDSMAHVTVTLYASNGTAMVAPLELAIPKNGLVKGNLWDLFTDNPILLNQTGWLEVVSDVDQIVGIISFTNSDNDYLASFELSGTSSSRFLFPLVSEDSTYKTEIALLNSDEQNGAPSANVQLELWDLSGNKVATKSISLPARARMLETVSSLFPGAEYRTCNIRVSSDRPVHGIAVLSDRLLHFVSAVPAVPYPGQ